MAMSVKKGNKMKSSNYIWIMLLALVLICTGCANNDAPFTIIMLPDTQNYADTRYKKQGLEEYFYAQTEWIKQNTEPLNIAMVAHVGDIVQTDCRQEWQIADKAFQTIDDSTPYILSLGNHDMGYEQVSENPVRHRTAENRKTQINNFFPPARFDKKTWYGGNLNDSSENYYCTFTAGGIEFLIISLEFVPRDDTLTWAYKIVASHPNHRTIVITHWYLKANAKKFTANRYGTKGNNAEQMWEKFVSQHQNIFMVLCGHEFGESILTSTGTAGNKVYQILADYQNHPNGGNAFLRIIKFIPTENKIEIKTYSPTEEKFITTNKSQFTLQYNMKKI
jgi:hypothetical protein